jgi:heat shock protein HslJ
MRTFFMILMAGAFFASCNSNKATTTKTAAEQTSANKTLDKTYWVLTEIDGKPSFIYFDAAKKRVSVSGGCNVMGGSYELMEGSRIKFGQMISTLMACPDMTIEGGLKKMTEMADNYAIQGDNLSFAKGRMAPVARFKAEPAPSGFKFD